MRTSAIGVAVGTLVFVAGWRWFRVLLFPISLTALVIPIPPVIFYQLTFPLQVMATKFGVAALELSRIPVLREGNVIWLTHTTLEVTEACSGIRSLLSLFTLAVLYGYFVDSRSLPRVLIAASSIPIAIIANGLRIAGTGLAAHYIGPSAATGFFHSFSGWTVFITSFVMLLAVANAVKRLPLPRTGMPPQPELSLS
jgi:exosortase